ncbi:MAG: hypothetical protein AAF532_13970 [Planctomycetota bacterium]
MADAVQNRAENGLSATQVKFIGAYVQHGTVRKAAEIAGVSRNTHSRWVKERPDYAEAFRDAVEDFADHWEEEAKRQAFGEEGSPKLIEFMLKALRPEKYRERVDVTRREDTLAGLTEEQITQRAMRLGIDVDAVLPDGEGPA